MGLKPYDRQDKAKDFLPSIPSQMDGVIYTYSTSCGASYAALGHLKPAVFMLRSNQPKEVKVGQSHG